MLGSGKLSLTVNSLTRRKSMHRRIELSRLRTTTICELQSEIKERMILSSIILYNSSLTSCLRDRGIRLIFCFTGNAFPVLSDAE